MKKVFYTDQFLIDGDMPREGESQLSKDVVADMLHAMANGVVHFVYMNAKGEPREAFGTAKRELIPNVKLTPEVTTVLRESVKDLIIQSKWALECRDEFNADAAPLQYAVDVAHSSMIGAFGDPNKTKKSMPPSAVEYINYFDFEAQNWRKFKPDNVVAIF